MHYEDNDNWWLCQPYLNKHASAHVTDRWVNPAAGEMYFVKNPPLSSIIVCLKLKVFLGKMTNKYPLLGNSHIKFNFFSDLIC